MTPKPCPVCGELPQVVLVLQAWLTARVECRCGIAGPMAEDHLRQGDERDPAGLYRWAAKLWNEAPAHKIAISRQSGRVSKHLDTVAEALAKEREAIACMLGEAIASTGQWNRGPLQRAQEMVLKRAGVMQ